MRSDDEGSFGSTRSASSRSFPGGFSIDWDEIDSIAEESLSVASSVSSGQRRRKTATVCSRQRSRMAGSPPNNAYDAMECGSAGPCQPDASPPPKELDSKERRSRPWTPASPRKRYVANAKRFVVVVGLSMCAIFGLQTFGTYIVELGTTARDINIPLPGTDPDRPARRLLSRSEKEYTSRRWPVSVRDEENDFELMSHPANEKVTLSVPRFYLSGDDGSMQSLGNLLGNNRLSRHVSSLVGRTAVEGSQDLSVRTIFVGIASYRDWHCRYTIESVFSRAKHPERLRVAVVDQLEQGSDQSCFVPIVPCDQEADQALCAHRDQIDVYEMDSNLGTGPTFAQHILNRMYRGEYYSLLVDPHTTFIRDWDADIVQQFEATRNDMAVITTYLGEALGSIDDITGTVQRHSRLVICNAEFEGTGYDRRLQHDISKQPDSLPSIQGMPQLQPYWSSSFSFSRGHFVLSVPADPFTPMVRQADMDISMAIRAFTHGYDFYTPERSVTFDSAYGDRDSRKTFLEHKDLYEGYELTSYKRLYGIVGMDGDKDPMDWTNDPHELYSIGHARPLVGFWNAFGVHAREKITERKLCNFVQTGRMHKMFHEHLRPDGMGLDYNQISFRFHELQNNHDGGT